MRELAAYSDLQDIVPGCQELLRHIQEYSPRIVAEIQGFNEDIQRARDGSLTHSQWCAERGVAKTTTKSQEEFIESLLQKSIWAGLASGWLGDIEMILEHSILAPLDPSRHSTAAYLNRMFLNLHGIFQTILESLSSPARSSSTDLAIDNLKIACVQSLMETELLSAIRSLIEIHELSPHSIPCMREHFRKVYEGLKPIIELSLHKFAEIAENNSREYADLPLLEKTVWFAKIYILFNDLGVLLNEPQEDEILPPEYLAFLALENGESDAAPPPPQPLPAATASSAVPTEYTPAPAIESPPATASSSSTPLPQTSSSSSDAAPAAAVAAALAPRAVTRDAPSSSSFHAQDDVLDARELLTVRKQRDVRRVLARLGFSELPKRGHGSHRIFANQTGQMTVVPAASEVSIGVRHAILAQVTAAAASASTDRSGEGQKKNGKKKHG